MTSAKKLIALGVFAIGALSVSGMAQARDDVYWSVGVGGPGLVMGASNVPPVFAAPAPVYVEPEPVYVPPRPVYVVPGYGVPVTYPRYRRWHHGHEYWEHHHWRHEHGDDDDD